MKILRPGLVIATVAFSSSAIAQDLPGPLPEAYGFSSTRLERLDEVVERAISDQEISGAVVLIRRHGDTVIERAYGESDVASGRKMRVDDIFRIASMTKAITSVATLMLFEEGRFSLDDPVDEYLPEFSTMNVIVQTEDGFELAPAEGKITIRHLLTHTSGLSYRFMNVSPVSGMYTEKGLSDGFAGETYSLDWFVENLASLPLLHEPGTQWTYGLNTDVLGRLIEVVSGDSLDEFFQRRIFEPLRMDDTWFEIPANQRDRMAALHRRGVSGELEVVPAGQIEDGATIYAADYPYDGAQGFLSGGGGLSSTAQDYGRFLQMILNGGELDGSRILSRKTVELMLSDQTERLGIEPNPDWAYTLAFARENGPSDSGRIGSDGLVFWSGIFNTRYFVDKEEGLAAILLTQRHPFGIELLTKFRVLVYQAMNE